MLPLFVRICPYDGSLFACFSYPLILDAAKLTDEALDAAEFLKQHIVQAKLNDQGRYGMYSR